jgi:transposase
VVPEHIDHVQTVRADSCEHCAADLFDAQATGARSHYVYMLPPIRPIVTEYQCLDLKCSVCALVTLSPLPPGVPKGQYDPSVLAMTGLLRGELRQSVRQTSSVMTKVLHVPMSSGMVAKAQEQLSCALEPAHTEAHGYTQAHQRPHADETSWRLDKKKAWLWVSVCGLVTVFLIHASRGKQAAKALLGSLAKGILVTDRWVSYEWIDATRRQLCFSHLKRDFKGFLDYGGEAQRLGEALLCEVRRLFRAWHKVRDGTLERKDFQARMTPVRRRILALLEEGGGLSCQKVRGKCNEILRLKEALFTFIDVDGVEPTNNAAERALRFAVLWRKGCFGSDSARGCRFVERFLTVRATLRSQNRDLYTYLLAACTAALNGHRPPSILPLSTQDSLPLAAAA